MEVGLARPNHVIKSHSIAGEPSSLQLKPSSRNTGPWQSLATGSSVITNQSYYPISKRVSGWFPKMGSESQFRLLRREITQKRVRISAVLVFLIIYVLWMSTAATFLHGNLMDGVWWSSAPPGSLFPIPYGPGHLMMLVIANPVDTFIFCALFQSGLWLVFIILSMLYILFPYTISMV